MNIMLVIPCFYSPRRNASSSQIGQKLTGMGASASGMALDADPTLQGGSTETITTPTRSKRKPFSMAPVDRDDLENIRVPRPRGVPEWGVMRGGEEAPVIGQRKEDRWV